MGDCDTVPGLHVINPGRSRHQGSGQGQVLDCFESVSEQPGRLVRVTCLHAEQPFILHHMRHIFVYAFRSKAITDLTSGCSPSLHESVAGQLLCCLAKAVQESRLAAPLRRRLPPFDVQLPVGLQHACLAEVSLPTGLHSIQGQRRVVHLLQH